MEIFWAAVVVVVFLKSSGMVKQLCRSYIKKKIR